jgi:ATP-dependent Lhr-like helicase
MVATSSLELGLDIGTIDLVVQISSPRSIHAFIQRAEDQSTIRMVPRARCWCR